VDVYSETFFSFLRKEDLKVERKEFEKKNFFSQKISTIIFLVNADLMKKVILFYKN
jgi:hypothetical protein